MILPRATIGRSRKREADTGVYSAEARNVLELQANAIAACAIARMLRR